MARGATFDPALEEKVGHCIGREVRAFGGNLFAGVCINMPYNPGWGRSQETYGEETYQIGQMEMCIRDRSVHALRAGKRHGMSV